MPDRITGTITVAGFLGAGKSALAARLREALPGRAVVEAGGGDLPSAGAAGPVVAVADAANLPGCLGDTLVGPLVAAQLRAAGLVVLSRTDLVPAGPALDALAGVTDAPVVEAPPGDLPAGLAERIGALGGAQNPGPAGPPAAPVRFAEWRYAGPATIRAPALEALLERRPPGLYRLSGLVRGGNGGFEVETVGRLRQTRPIPQPAETVLLAVGPRGRFRPDRMALAFSDAVATAGWLSGLFGHR